MRRQIHDVYSQKGGATYHGGSERTDGQAGKQARRMAIGKTGRLFDRSVRSNEATGPAESKFALSLSSYRPHRPCRLMRYEHNDSRYLVTTVPGMRHGTPDITATQSRDESIAGGAESAAMAKKASGQSPRLATFLGDMESCLPE
jgi:hypothetical protein